MKPARTTIRGTRARRGATLLAAVAAVSLALPVAASVAEKPFYKAKTVTLGSSAEARTSVAAAAASLTSGTKVGVYPDASTWAGNGITTIYAGPNQNADKFPLSKAKALLAKGVSLNITLHPKGTSHIAGIVSGNSSSMAWLNAYIANIKSLATYATSLNNGTYVVAALMHESQAQIRDGRVTGASANYTTIGKAQQIAIRLGKAAAPSAYWSVWIVGYDRSGEGTQLAQITNPKPDLITWDPYENHDCNGTLADVATEDLNWVKQQSAYNGNVALSETGINATCSDAQMAKFYTGMSGKLQAFDPDFRFAVVFNSNAGSVQHVIQSSKTQAIAALKASLKR